MKYRSIKRDMLLARQCLILIVDLSSSIERKMSAVLSRSELTVNSNESRT